MRKEIIYDEDGIKLNIFKNKIIYRNKKEIFKYKEEAFDKVWLMRNWDTNNPKGQEAVERIENTYDDIPEDGYTDWECGYWNGILAALRWVEGDGKNSLDS